MYGHTMAPTFGSQSAFTVMHATTIATFARFGIVFVAATKRTKGQKKMLQMKNVSFCISYLAILQDLITSAIYINNYSSLVS